MVSGFGPGWEFRKPNLPQAKPKPGLSGQAGPEQQDGILCADNGPAGRGQRTWSENTDIAKKGSLSKPSLPRVPPATMRRSLKMAFI
jgi:hypothetical protein